MEDNNKPENPLAFPNTDTIANGERYLPIEQGMTLRDYFAAKAMQGIVSTLSGQEANIYYNQIALDSFDIADAMLKERQKTN